MSCLWNGGNILPTGLGRGHGTVVMVGRANPFDMEDFADAVVDGDKATGNAAFMAIYDDGDALALSPKQLVVVGTLPQVRLTAAAIREDGCVIAVGEAAPGAATDVFVYSRPLPE